MQAFTLCFEYFQSLLCFPHAILNFWTRRLHIFILHGPCKLSSWFWLWEWHFWNYPFFFFFFFKSVKVYTPPPTYLVLSLMVCFSSDVTTCMHFLRLCQAAPCLWSIGLWCFLLFISPSMTWFISIHGLKCWESETQLWNLTWPTHLITVNPFVERSLLRRTRHPFYL